MSLFSVVSAWLPRVRTKINRRRLPGSITSHARRSLRLAVEQLESRELLSGLTAAIGGLPTSAQSPVGTPIHLAASLTGTTAGAAYTYSWHVFANGTAYATNSAKTFTFTPDDHGSYTIDLTVSDKLGDQATADAMLTVNAVPPTAHIVGSITGSALVPMPLHATATDPSSVDKAAGFTYNWNFGDNTTASGAALPTCMPRPAPTTLRSPRPTRTASRAPQRRRSTSTPPAAPKVAITGVPALHRSPVATAITLGSSLTNTAANDTYTLTWKVLLNGNLFATGGGSSVTFTPQASGVYAAYLTVTDQFGTKVTVGRGIRVYDMPPTVQIASSFDGAALSPLTFRASATNVSSFDIAGGFRYRWVFGDGTTVWGTAPTHTYARPGTYTVHVYAYNRHGLDGRATTTVTIIPAITATLTAPAPVIAGSTDATVSFANVAGGSGSGYTYSFDFANIGSFQVTGSSNPSATIPASYVAIANSTLVVHGRVTDGNGDYRDFTTRVNVVNQTASPAITPFFGPRGVADRDLQCPQIGAGG